MTDHARCSSAPSVFEAQLEDVTRTDAEAGVIAQTRLPSPGNPPIRFTIPYDAAAIQAHHAYVVRARIVAGEKVLFTTDKAHPVLTRGNPNTVSLLLRRTATPAGTPMP
jgi:putative lipoprotein